uniref:ATP synthase complex subunit 8 n=1 Tax=Cosmetura nigrogeniculata TaxID=948388 RepID=A0A649UCQ5_9ORTH|nr:ATP synthase F0 subunit 8 [Acosmetura nigrogeniculata]QGI24228.1 ATP synthase F0 subunit 8 [Acosmetura nigrogeniculata]
MPQMAPMSWLFLFTMFSSALILFSIINYFFTIYQPFSSSYKENSLPQISLNWKW